MENYIIDTHIHLNDEQYENDLNEVIEKTKQKNIKKIILIGCDLEGINKAIEMQKVDRDDFIYLALGFHPVDVDQFSEENLNLIKKVAKKNSKVVAIGEIGLDYYHKPYDELKQKEIFKKQIKLAKELNLPVIIHCRDAVNDCYKILQEENFFNGVIHGFNEYFSSAKLFLDKGMYIGIGGPVTFKNGQPQQDVVKQIDLNKLLIETDGPYLTPVPFRGKRNESAYLQYVVEKIAEIRNLKEEEVIKKTTENAKALFKGLQDV